MILSNYCFEKTDYQGNTKFYNISHRGGVWAYISSPDIGSAKSTLVWEREDREIVIDLVPIFNNPIILSYVDGMFAGSPARMIPPIKAGWIQWRHVPYRDNSRRHGDFDFLIRVFFNFHIDTPWYCSDADGNISYYIFAYLVGGRLNARVEHWSYEFNGGNLIGFIPGAVPCKGEIKDALNNSVPKGVDPLQHFIDTIFLPTYANRTYDYLYLLPGNGARSGNGTVNVDEHVSIALLPRR